MPKKLFTSESARENQLKSAQSRHLNAENRNKTIRETATDVLNQPLKDKTKLQELYDWGFPKNKRYTIKEYITAKICMNAAGKGKPDDLLKLMEIIGEDTESAIVEDSAAYFEAGELTDADREND